MKISLRVILTLMFTVALFAAFAITASALNWYATEAAEGVDKLYITAADSAPNDGKSWSPDVPSPYDGTAAETWIFIPPNATKPVEIIIDGDVKFTSTSLFYGIYAEYSSMPVTITGNGTGKLTIDLTGDIRDISAAIYIGSQGGLTISDMADMTLAAAASTDTSAGIYSISNITITDSTLGNITAGNATNSSHGIYNLFDGITITNSTLGDITAGDALGEDGDSYGIYSISNITITDSTLGDITAGDADYNSCGIYGEGVYDYENMSCTGGLKITNSKLGNITTGDAYYTICIEADNMNVINSEIGDITAGNALYYICGIFVDDGYCLIKESTIGAITTGDVTAYDGAIDGIKFNECYVTITDSTIGDITTGSYINSDFSDPNNNYEANICGINSSYDFTIEGSTIGNITTGSINFSNIPDDVYIDMYDGRIFGIYCGYIKITDSTIGSIITGNIIVNDISKYYYSGAGDNDNEGSIRGLCVYDLFEITNSVLGDITTGNIIINDITDDGDDYYRINTFSEVVGVYVYDDFKITDSTLGKITTGNITIINLYNNNDYYDGYNYGIYCYEGALTITDSTLGDITAGDVSGKNGNSYGINAAYDFVIISSTFGDITAGDVSGENGNSYGINAAYDFVIISSTFGDITAGDALGESGKSSGIYVNGYFYITDSTLGNITAGDALGEYGESYGINVYDFTITDSTFGDISAGDASNEDGDSYGIYVYDFTITDSTFGDITAGDASDSCGMTIGNFTVGEVNPNAKYPLNLTATGKSHAIYIVYNFYDAVGTIKLAGEDKDSAVSFDDADDFENALETAKYARISVQQVATVAEPTITEATVNQEGKKLITITCATPDAKIYYRLDGGEITTPADGTLYNGPFEIGKNASITARAFKDGYSPSMTAKLEVEFSRANNTDFIQYMFLVTNQPVYSVSVADGVTAAVKAGLNLNALRVGELVTITVEANEDGGYTAPTVTTTGGGKVYLTDMGGGVYTFKMPGCSVIIKP